MNPITGEPNLKKSLGIPRKNIAAEKRIQKTCKNSLIRVYFNSNVFVWQQV